MAGEPILIVDDNPANLKLARVLLAGEGYEVRTAAHAEEALALLEGFRPRLILMDLQLPGMDGLELTRRLKADPATRDIVVLAMTAYAMKGDEEKARAAGCDGYVTKPIDTRTLPGAVARYLSGGSDGKGAPEARSVPVVLVVEDNPITRKMLRVTLLGGGYTVAEAEDGRTALDLLRQWAPDLVLQDLLLPDMSGLELVRRLRALPEGARVPILALSGLASRLAEAGEASEFDDLLVKPVEPSRLLQVVQSYLPARGLSAEGPGAGRSVLVVDDDPIQRKLLALRLAEMQFRVVTAEDGAEALEKARAAPPDAIVTDVLMPRLDGFGLALAVRRDPRLGRVPVVLASSSYVEEEDRRLARKAGATAFVLRTPDLGDLIEALLEGLGSEPPASVAAEASGESLGAEHHQRLMRQVERQAVLNRALAQQCSLQAAELAVLGGVAEALSRARDAEEALEEILARCLDAGGISRGALYLRDPDGSLRLRVQLGFDPTDHDGIEGLFGHEELLREVLAASAAIEVPSPAVGEGVARDLLGRSGCSRALLVPVASREERMGVLLMASTGPEWPAECLTFARTVALQIGQAVALTRAFSRIRESEERYRRLLHQHDLILNSAGEGIYGADLEGRAVFMNPAGARLLGYEPEEIFGRVMHDLAHHTRPDGTPFPKSDCPLSASLRAGTAYRAAEDLFWRKDGTSLLVEYTSTPIFEEGRPVGGVVVVRDITERKRQQEELRSQREALYRSEKLAAMGELLAGVAHELNNPLSVLLGQASLLRRAAGEGPLSERAEKISTAAERCARIVRNFLALARQQAPERQPVSLNQVVQEALELLAYPLRVDNVEVVQDLEGDLPVLWADGHQLHQVVVNLVTNAQHAMKAVTSRRLTLRTRFEASSRRILLEVADTGPGIPPEIGARIFEPFFTTKPTGQGTGLGLSLCQGIVESHGGLIRVDSEPGPGALFRVELPVEPAAPPEFHVAEAPPPGPARSILVVDDEATVREVLQELLQSDGHEVDLAEDGTTALERLRGRSYDLVLTDIKMPSLDGPGLYRELERLRPELVSRVVFMTGDTFGPETREFLERTGVATLSKPFDLEAVRRTLRRALGEG